MIDRVTPWIVVLGLLGCTVPSSDQLQGTSGTSTVVLKCTRIVVERGTTGLTQGESVASLAVRDESGTADDWTRYVNFDKSTSAICTFALPAGTTPSSVVSATMTVNYCGPRKADMLWTFTAKDVVAGTYVPVTDNGFAADWEWSATTIGLPTPARLFASDGSLRLRYSTTSRFDNSELDQLVVTVTLGGTTTSPPDAGVPPATDSGTTTTTPPLGAHLYGVTVDDIASLSSVVAALHALPKKPTARIVFDEGQAPSYYATAVPQIHAVSNVMGEILDSAYMTRLSVAQYTQRTSNYLAAFSTGVDLWEVGNEINGNWLGTTSDVVAKMTGAYDLVKAVGGRTELTLYGCSDAGASYDLFNWVTANVPARMLSGLDYVLVSYYEGDCGNPRSDWQSVFDRLHQLFPNAGIGFGEVGATDANGNDITDPSIAGPYLNKYYGMPITTPRYVGGYFWWYFAEDMVPTTKAMFPILSAAIQAMP